MPVTTGLLLAGNFIASLFALAFLIWAIASRQLAIDQSDAETVFEAACDHPACGSDHLARYRLGLRSHRRVQAPLAGLAGFHRAAYFQQSSCAAFELGHLWLALAGGPCLRRMGHPAPISSQAAPWASVHRGRNALERQGDAGRDALASGWTDGEEWLELPWQIDILLAAAALFIAPVIATKKRTSVADLPTGPKEPRSSVLSIEEEAIVVAFRKYTLLPLDNCLYALQPTIPHLTRSSLRRRA